MTRCCSLADFLADLVEGKLARQGSTIRGVPTCRGKVESEVEEGSQRGPTCSRLEDIDSAAFRVLKYNMASTPDPAGQRCE